MSKEMTLLEAAKIITDLRDELAAYTWKPANEPPEEDGIYFVRRQDNIVPTARVFNDGVWHSHDTILFWMPIPPLPPKKGINNV